MTMLQLVGPAAETDFRLSKLRQRFRLRLDVIRDVSVSFIHFVHLSDRLSDSDSALLQALLTYGAKADPISQGQKLYVVPRLGTISPWSSKATDIARICGFPVHRLERGRCYSFDMQGLLDPVELLDLPPLLHDRMTETLLSEAPSEGQLFIEHQARPLDSIDLLRHGIASLKKANVNLGWHYPKTRLATLPSSLRRLGAILQT